MTDTSRVLTAELHAIAAWAEAQFRKSLAESPRQYAECPAACAETSTTPGQEGQCVEETGDPPF